MKGEIGGDLGYAGIRDLGVDEANGGLTRELGLASTFLCTTRCLSAQVLQSALVRWETPQSSLRLP